MGNTFDFKKFFAILSIIIIVVAIAFLIIENIKGNSRYKVNEKVSKVNNKFNNQWLAYNGSQLGANLRGFIDALINNARNNSSDPTKLIDIAYQAEEQGKIIEVFSTVQNINIEGLKEAKEQLRSKHAYTVEFKYSKQTGNISAVVIKYNKNDKISIKPNET